MKIVAPSPPQRPLRGPEPATGQTIPDRSGENFATMLGLVPVHTVSEDSSAPSAHFKIETQIGEDAIRFDARPIVGASAQVTADTLAALADTGPASPEASLGPAALADLCRQIAEQAPLIARRLVETVASRPAVMESGLPAAATRHAPAMPHTAAPAMGAVARLNMTSKDSMAPSRPALSPAWSPPTDRNGLAARIASWPHEVAIIVRGATLSAQDSQILVEEVRTLLHRHGLGDRMIRIVTPSRRV